MSRVIPVPKSGRLTRSPGIVKSICSMSCSMCWLYPLVSDESFIGDTEWVGDIHSLNVPLRIVERSLHQSGMIITGKPSSVIAPRTSSVPSTLTAAATILKSAHSASSDALRMLVSALSMVSASPAILVSALSMVSASPAILVSALSMVSASPAMLDSPLSIVRLRRRNWYRRFQLRPDHW